MDRALTRRGVTILVALAGSIGCGAGESTGVAVPAGAALEVTVTGLPALDPAREGRYEAWVTDRSGTPHSLGALDVSQGSVFTRTTPVAEPASLEISVERSGDNDGTPSAQVLLRGVLQHGRAALTVAGAVTQGNPFREHPGQFTMFSPSDNSVHGYPSYEESGVWLFNMAPRETPQNDMWVRLTQLEPGWIYEGWMVRDIDTPAAIWLSYGKFTPDATGAVNRRDDTGWGPFSGVTDFPTAGEEEFPGDDWISNPLGFAFPPGVSLPLNLREKNAQNASRWTHVITIEPATDRGEGVLQERPFIIRPYRDAFGDGAPGTPRTITYHGNGVPSGTVERR